MKVKLSLAAIVVVGFIVLGACNTTSSVGSCSSPAYNSGQLFGSSLLSLYSDYKQAGKIDMSNTGTMLQVAQLATSCSVIKQNLSNKDFYMSFVEGAVLGSQQNVTQNNASNIINTLTGVDFGNIADAVANGGTLSPGTVSGVVNSLNSVFSMFGK